MECTSVWRGVFWLLLGVLAGSCRLCGCLEAQAPDLLELHNQFTVPAAEDEGSDLFARDDGNSPVIATAECWKSIRCKTSKRRPVCATDGRTYPSKCDIKRMRKCAGKKDLDIRAKGRCPTSVKPPPASGCNARGRAEFGANLLQHFSEEYFRLDENSKSALVATGDLSVVADWKFNNLDANRDGVLRRPEIRELAGAIRKLVSPKMCAKRFNGLCDSNQDDRISRQEWFTCLGLTDGSGGEDRTGTGSRGRDTFPSVIRGGVASVLGRTTVAPPLPRDSSAPRRSVVCETERQVALRLDAVSQARIFIPVCQEDGKFRPEQCHEATNYCWCVDPDSGSPVPGTSVFNAHPRCQTTTVPPTTQHQQQPQPTRVFKGCPQSQKRHFLREVLDQIILEMSDSSHDSVSLASVSRIAELQKVIRWKLDKMDVNGNGFLDRAELDSFKADIRKQGELRKCSRNFVRYCDRDSDRKISPSEWLDCLEPQHYEQRDPRQDSSPRRQGPNPFSTWLKSSPVL